MRNKNKIVRLKEVQNTDDSIDRHYYETYLTTFSDYISKTNYKGYGSSYVKLSPYKWYEIQRLWTITSFWLLLKIFRNNRIKISAPLYKATSVIVFFFRTKFDYKIYC